MRKLTEQDMNSIIGTTCGGYTIIQARVMGGEFSDSDHYGIALGLDEKQNFVTWQFHIEEETPKFYWGHYHNTNRDAAMRDYRTRG